MSPSPRGGPLRYGPRAHRPGCRRGRATGRTFEEEWHAREDLASHRDLLASAIYAVEVAPAGTPVDAGEDLVDHS